MTALGIEPAVDHGDGPTRVAAHDGAQSDASRYSDDFDIDESTLPTSVDAGVPPRHTAPPAAARGVATTALGAEPDGLGSAASPSPSARTPHASRTPKLPSLATPQAPSPSSAGGPPRGVTKPISLDAVAGADGGPLREALDLDTSASGMVLTAQPPEGVTVLVARRSGEPAPAGANSTAPAVQPAPPRRPVPKPGARRLRRPIPGLKQGKSGEAAFEAPRRPAQPQGTAAVAAHGAAATHASTVADTNVTPAGPPPSSRFRRPPGPTAADRGSLRVQRDGGKPASATAAASPAQTPAAGVDGNGGEGDGQPEAPRRFATPASILHVQRPTASSIHKRFDAPPSGDAPQAVAASGGSTAARRPRRVRPSSRGSSHSGGLRRPRPRIHDGPTRPPRRGRYRTPRPAPRYTGAEALNSAGSGEDSTGFDTSTNWSEHKQRLLEHLQRQLELSPRSKKAKQSRMRRRRKRAAAAAAVAASGGAPTPGIMITPSGLGKRAARARRIRRQRMLAAKSEAATRGDEVTRHQLFARRGPDMLSHSTVFEVEPDASPATAALASTNCDNCGGPATRRCLVCHEAYCKLCDNVIHARASKKAHTRIQLRSRRASPSSSNLKDNDVETGGVTVSTSTTDLHTAKTSAQPDSGAMWASRHDARAFAYVVVLDACARRRLLFADAGAVTQIVKAKRLPWYDTWHSGG